MKKRRPSSGAILNNLPQDQLKELIRWLVDGEPYRVVQQKLAEQFGVKASFHPICEFWRTYCAPDIGKRDDFIRSLARTQFTKRFPGGRKPERQTSPAPDPQASNPAAPSIAASP